jgi:hypothetical protein
MAAFPVRNPTFQPRTAIRGITRFELLLGVSVVAVVSGLVGLWTVGEQGLNPQAEAEKRGKAVLTAASDWKRAHAQTGCPSITQLQRDEALDKAARAEDPWGKRYRILCTSDEIQVRSAGGDGRFETPDDITLATQPNT